MNREDLIRRAAELPAGSPERRSLLANLADKTAKVEMYQRRPGVIAINVRVQISAGLVGNVIDNSKRVLGQIETALKSAQATLKKDLAWVDPAGAEVPPLEQLGLSVGRAGLIVDHYWYFGFEAPGSSDEEDAAKYGPRVIKVLTKAFKAAGIKV